MIIDAFHGAGGWAEGLAALGRTSVGVELDSDAVATSRAAGHHVVQADVAAIDPRELLNGERCEGLIASPPCPSFSNAGKRLGRQDMPAIHQLIDDLAHGVDLRAQAHMHDERSRLTAEPMRWVYLLEPDWIALEQVPAILPIWQQMEVELEYMGYRTWTGIVHAERYGVPQTRQRAVLLASRTHEVGEPQATRRRYYPSGHKLADDPPDAHLPNWISMAGALGWGMTERPSMSVTSGGTYTGGAEVFGNGAHKGIRRERTAGRWADGIHDDMPQSTQALRSADWPNNRPATTIAGDPRVFPPGGHHVPGAQSHGSIRVSVADAGILQTFRSNYPWQGNAGKQHMQVGNAVPPKLATALLAEVMGQRAHGRLNLAAFAA